MPSSRWSSEPRSWTWVSCISCVGMWVLTTEPPERLKVQLWTILNLTLMYIIDCDELEILCPIYDTETDLKRLADLSKVQQLVGIRIIIWSPAIYSFLQIFCANIILFSTIWLFKYWNKGIDLYLHVCTILIWKGIGIILIINCLNSFILFCL